jgi:hypothetical protein
MFGAKEYHQLGPRNLEPGNKAVLRHFNAGAGTGTHSTGSTCGMEHLQAGRSPNKSIQVYELGRDIRQFAILLRLQRGTGYTDFTPRVGSGTLAINESKDLRPFQVGDADVPGPSLTAIPEERPGGQQGNGNRQPQRQGRHITPCESESVKREVCISIATGVPPP